MDYEIYNRKMSDFFSPDNDGHEEEEDAKMEDDNTQTKGEDDATQGDKKEDVEMMSQSDEIYADDVKMGSQKQDDSPDDETLEQVKEKSEKGDSKVEESPAAKENLEEGNKEKEREEDKKENNGGDTEVAGEEKGGSPEKKMQTGQTDEEGQQRKDPTKSAGTQEGTIEEAEVAMDVHDADKSETESAMEKNTTSTKVEMKAQDKSSQEPASIPTDSSQSKDGQVSKCAQRKE
ncbi:neurofilament medium polypeptide-like [Xyrauchen texanus]|uniref:neurofilament medium polypeptide-like n=1 Tax=Xyrauchen texanus TaxID=154827 RepID=UPI002241C88C|nr:neurofilament medium polypeptide-like [Xyrauchen texanus]